jgi:signal transduction histidine kinase
VANAGVWLGQRSWSRIAEIACLATGLVTVNHFVFGRFAGQASLLALLYAQLPLLLWVAMRFELAGVSWALLVIGFQSTWSVIHGRGPFVSQSPDENILQLQLFLLAISLPLMFLAVVIQERRRASSALYETQLRLSHAARLAIVGELTASIAHEINQPLGAILSNADAAEMLLDSAPASLPEVRQILNDIRKDDLRASEVIRRLRALLRKREMELEPVDLNEIILEVVALIRPESGRRGIAIETELAANLPLVRGDNVHLQQILLNLLLNGMEAMADVPGAKTLSVRTALNDTSVEIAVMDLGSGIGPDRLTQLFDPFFSTKNHGLGLGLSIGRSLVEAHGGRIWADNNPDGGATFRFTVPVDVQLPGKGSSDMQGTSLELFQ